MICKWIEEAAATENIRVRRLGKERVDCIIETIRGRYGGASNTADYLWEEFVDDISVQTANGWQIACDYFTEGPIIVFRDGDDFEGFHVESTDCLKRLLSESPGFEFFVTNEEVDFVLCFNHHDFLIGVGKCREWLSGVRCNK